MPYELAPQRLEDFTEVDEVPKIAVSIEEYHRLKQNMESRLAPNTKRVYETGLKQWRIFCGIRNIPWFPARPEHVALWLSDLTDRGLTVETLKQRAKAISYIHREQNAVDPTTNQMVRDAIKSCPGNKTRKATPVDENYFKFMVNLSTRRDRALLLVMRWLMLRPSEAANLIWDDIDWDRHLVYISRSKTDQEGKGVWMHMPPNVRLALEEYRRRRTRRTVHVFNLTPNSISRVIRRLGERAGLNGVSGHSLRRGMACDLVGRGEGLGEIMVAGRWETPKMVARYAEEVAVTGALARYAKEINENN